MTRYGPDLSHHQDISDWTALAGAVHFVILKASEGRTFTDPAFASRWDTLGRRGIPRGAYHFARPGTGTAAAQADHFLDVVVRAGWTSGDVWALDLEDAGGRSASALVAWARSWCERVGARLGTPGLFYTYPAFWSGPMGAPNALPPGTLGWWARYADSPRAPAVWGSPPPIWQCGDGTSGCAKRLAGVGAVDWNQCTDAAFTRLWGQDTIQEDDMDEATLRRIVRDETRAALQAERAEHEASRGRWYRFLTRGIKPDTGEVSPAHQRFSTEGIRDAIDDLDDL